MQLSLYRQQCDAVEQGFDNVPVVYLDFGRAAWLMALAYGCPLAKINGLINAEVLYKSIEETERFKKTDKLGKKGCT